MSSLAPEVAREEYLPHGRARRELSSEYDGGAGHRGENRQRGPAGEAVGPDSHGSGGGRTRLPRKAEVQGRSQAPYDDAADRSAAKAAVADRRLSSARERCGRGAKPAEEAEARGRGGPGPGC